MTSLHEIVLKIKGSITGPWNIGHSDLHLFWGQTSGCSDSYYESMMYIHQIVFKIRQNHWTMKYRSWGPTFILRSCIGSYWFIIPNNDYPTWNSLQGKRHIHWPIKYMSQWPTFILRSNFWSYWFILRKYDVHTSNSLQDIRQNHWTVKYRSQWPTFILGSCIGSYWFIILNNDVHTWNSLQGIRQNHWTMKYRSQWPTVDKLVPVYLQKAVDLPLEIIWKCAWWDKAEDFQGFH